MLDIITEKFDIQVDENTQTQAALLHDDIPGYDLPTIDFVQTSEDDDEDVSILEEDNPQIYAHLDNVLVHMIDKQEAAIFKSKQDFNQNKEKISEYIKYAENWRVILVICSYTAMACDVLLIVTMIVFFLKYRKTMQAMLAAFIKTNTKNSSIQSVQADKIGRTYLPLFKINLLKEEEILENLKEISAIEYVVQVIMIIVCIAVVIIIMYFCCTICRHTRTVFKYYFPFLPMSCIVCTSHCTDLFVEVTNITKGNSIWAHFTATGCFPLQIRISRRRCFWFLCCVHSERFFLGRLRLFLEKSLRLEKNRCDPMGSVPILSQRFYGKSQSLTVNDTLVFLLVFTYSESDCDVANDRYHLSPVPILMTL